MTEINGGFCQRRPLFYGALLTLATGLLFSFQGQAQTATRTITIASGGPNGVYSPLAKAICTAVNRRKSTYNIDCTANNTGGSTDNLNRLKAGTVNFAIVQSDVLYYAANGFGPFASSGANKTLRTVLSLHPESLAVVARADAGIKTFDDLKGKRVNIGNPGSGQRTTMELLMRAKGFTKNDFSLALELTADAQAQKLCANQIDAMVFLAGHPNVVITNATKSCPTNLVQVADLTILRMVNKVPYLHTNIIPAKTYDGTPNRTLTIGTVALLVTTDTAADTLVYDLTSIIYKAFINIKFSHPALASLSPEGMFGKGDAAPLHPGAISYFQDAGETLHEASKVTNAPKR